MLFIYSGFKAELIHKGAFRNIKGGTTEIIDYRLYGLL